MNARSRAFWITPPGRSAIATIAVLGEHAARDCEPFFHSASGRQLGELSCGAIAFGRWGGDQGEELVVVVVEQGVEIHCHGGFAAARAILDQLAAVAEVFDDNNEWLNFQFVDIIEREAVVALANATTTQAAMRLLAQRQGRLRARIDDASTAADADPPAAIASLQQLLDEARFGMHLTAPWKVTLRGKPNVGKSSLINRIVGYDRAVVFDQPGTTRDVLSASSPLEGWPVHWSDTAGLRAADDPLEREGVLRAEAAQESADLILHVVDVSAEESPPPPAPNTIMVGNKIDLAPRTPLPSTWIGVSAATGVGLDALLHRVAEHLFGDAPADIEHPLLFTARQVSEARSLLDEVSSRFGDRGADSR